MKKQVHICRYCKNPVLKRGRHRFHVHCKRLAGRKGRVVLGDIQEPKNRRDRSRNDRLVATRIKEVKCNGGEVAFIVSRTPQHKWQNGECVYCGARKSRPHFDECKAPAAEVAIRPAGMDALHYKVSELINLP